MDKVFNNVTVLGEPLRDRIRKALKRYGVNQSDFAKMFGVGKMQASSWCTGKRPVPARYWALIERWIATGTAPESDDLERLKKPAGYASKPITIEELERVGATCTYLEAASYFGYNPVTFRGLINDNRDFREAFNRVAKDKLPIRQVENLASVGCNLKTIGRVYDLSEDQVQRIFDTWYEFQQAFEKGVADMEVAIRMKQFQLLNLDLQGLNVKTASTMAIYLGKVILKQNDSPKPEKEDPNAAKEIVVRWATEQEAADIRGGASVTEDE